jgi:cytochrome c oxidase cbb3-type subunit I/II
MVEPTSPDPQPEIERRHRRFEGRTLAFSVVTFLAVVIGGPILIIPPLFMQGQIRPVPGVKPYTALELEGRDLYIREGCSNCHSQQVRPLKAEVDRYGPRSLAGESIYDRPFLWGSRRTGPDLARLGGKYPDAWHWRHTLNPRDIEPRSIMPPYPWLFERELDLSHTQAKLRVLRRLGTPYTEAQIAGAVAALRAQAGEIDRRLRSQGVPSTGAGKEIVALIAYLQRLGQDLKSGSAGQQTASRRP